MAKIKVNSTLLWKPDIVLHNSVTGNFKTTEQGHHYKSKSSGFPRQGSIHGTELSNDLRERNSWMATSCALSDKLRNRYKGTGHFWHFYTHFRPKFFSKNDTVKKYFPFDSQNCTLKFGSWSFSADEQVLLPTADNETLRYATVKMGWPVDRDTNQSDFQYWYWYCC